MNTNQLLYDTAYKMLVSMLPKGLHESDLGKYLVGERFKPLNLKDVYITFVRTAQNYQFMPNVIQFDNRKKVIADILHGFDYNYVSSQKPEVFYLRFKDAFGITSEKSWMLWSKAVVDSAKYIKAFSSIEAFDKYVIQSPELKKVPLDISKKITGIGFALACNALKDLGYLDYVKPDIHLIDICDELNISRRDPIAVFDAMQKIAKDNNITPYKLDKVLWLVCSGNFYEDGIRVKGKKDELINYVKGVSSQSAPTIRVRKHINDSDSDLQLEIEKLLIRKLEEKLGITGLQNDQYLSFKGNIDSKIKPDIFSDEHHLIGEVYTHLGKLKSSQVDKIAADILKMIVYNEDYGKDYEMYYVVCDEAVKKCMLGNAVISNAIRIHKVQVECFELNEVLKKKLSATMKRQDITD